MGRHSAAPRDRAPQLRRLTRNSLSVLIATLLTMLMVMSGIAVYATIKDHEIPLPTVAIDQTGSYVAAPDASTGDGVVPGPAAGGAAVPPTGLRQCPATGCSAPTCHAETGEPIPSR